MKFKFLVVLLLWLIAAGECLGDQSLRRRGSSRLHMSSRGAQEAKTLRSEGSTKYKAKNLVEANTLYSRALVEAETFKYGDTEELLARRVEAFLSYSNRAKVALALDNDFFDFLDTLSAEDILAQNKELALPLKESETLPEARATRMKDLVNRLETVKNRWIVATLGWSSAATISKSIDLILKRVFATAYSLDAPDISLRYRKKLSEKISNDIRTLFSQLHTKLKTTAVPSLSSSSLSGAESHMLGVKRSGVMKDTSDDTAALAAMRFAELCMLQTGHIVPLSPMVFMAINWFVRGFNLRQDNVEENEALASNPETEDDVDKELEKIDTLGDYFGFSYRHNKVYVDRNSDVITELSRVFQKESERTVELSVKAKDLEATICAKIAVLDDAYCTASTRSGKLTETGQTEVNKIFSLSHENAMQVLGAAQLSFFTDVIFPFKVHLVPLPSQVPRLMQDLLEAINVREAALASVESGSTKTAAIWKLAAYTYIQLIGIHPFEDGNGRTTRIIVNAILARHGITPKRLQTKSGDFLKVADPLLQLYVEQGVQTLLKYDEVDLDPLMTYMKSLEDVSYPVSMVVIDSKV